MPERVRLSQPARCFCAISEDEVQPWIIKRFVDNGRTIDLLRSTNNAREKEIITMVAMLDLDDDLVRSLMAHAGKTAAHVLACRNRVKGLWAKLGKA